MTEKVNAQTYRSPLGELLLASDGQELIGCWFEGQKYFAAGVDQAQIQVQEDRVLNQAAVWLDQYFGEQRPDCNLIKLRPQVTTFRQSVLLALRKVPYGQTITYQDLAAVVKNLAMSAKYARSVAGAVGHNPLSIFIPCHRVIGSDGSLTGYAGGLQRKQALLELEHATLNQY